MTPSVNTLCNEKLFVCNKLIHQDVCFKTVAVMSSIILLSPVKKSSESGEKYAH